MSSSFLNSNKGAVILDDPGQIAAVFVALGWRSLDLSSRFLPLHLESFFSKDEPASLVDKLVVVKDLFADHEKPCEINCLTIHVLDEFLAFSPNVDEVRKCVDLQWKVKSSVKICAMANGLFLFSFVSLEDLLRFLTGGL